MIKQNQWNKVFFEKRNRTEKSLTNWLRKKENKKKTSSNENNAPNNLH